MGLVSAVRSFFPSVVRATEGEFRPGPYQTNAGWLPDGTPWNFWQTGRDPDPSPTTSAMVEACVARYAQTVAMCAGSHWRTLDDGGRERVTNSALSRILKEPNSYQTASDFLMNATTSLYTEGNAYALAIRNDRGEASELHLMNPKASTATLSEDGEIFYALGGNEVIEKRLAIQRGFRLTVPARDVLHIKLKTPLTPLKGVTPLQAAWLDLQASGAMTAQQYHFYRNQARPSGIITSDMTISREQAEELRESWNAKVGSLRTGGIPILTGGFKFQPITATGADSQLAEVMKLTEQRIALVFGIPLAILGMSETPLASTESLMQSWLANSLGFCFNHIEVAFDKFFRLKGQPEEYTQFDEKTLLRSNMKDRFDALGKGVQMGILAPNEARNEEGYPDVPFGDDPRVQEQMVPLKFGTEKQAKPPAAPNPPAENAPPKPANDDAGEGRDADARVFRMLVNGRNPTDS